MPTFKIKNLTMSLDNADRVATPALNQQFCFFPTHPTFCHWKTPPWPPISCEFHSLIQCWTPWCQPRSPIVCLDPSGNPGGCGVNFSTLPPTTIDTLTPVIRVIDNPDVLGLLHQQLEEAIGVVNERGIEIEKGLRPQSLAQAEALEKELKAALDELKAMKKGLK